MDFHSAYGRIFLGKQLKSKGESAKKILTTFAFRYVSYFLYANPLSITPFFSSCPANVSLNIYGLFGHHKGFSISAGFTKARNHPNRRATDHHPPSSPIHV